MCFPGFLECPQKHQSKVSYKILHTVDSWDNLEGSGSTTPTASVGAAGSTAAPTTGASTCTASQNCACPTCDQTQTCTLVFVSEDFGILVFSPGSLLCSGSCRCFLFFSRTAFGFLHSVNNMKHVYTYTEGSPSSIASTCKMFKRKLHLESVFAWVGHAVIGQVCWISAPRTAKNSNDGVAMTIPATHRFSMDVAYVARLLKGVISATPVTT